MKLPSGSLLRNIATNTASYLITLGAAFLMFPVMIQKLGPARYGLWMLISQLTGYYSYLGLCIRAGVVYYAALHIARQERRLLNELLATSVWTLTTAGVILALSGFALASGFPLLFNADSNDLSETALSIEIMAVAVALSLPVEAMNSILTAGHRLDVVNGIEMFTRTASSVAQVVCVIKGGGLVPLSLIQLITRIVAVPVTAIAMHRTTPGLSMAPTHWRVLCLKQLARFGLPSMMIGAGWLISSRTDFVLIGATLGVPMVAYYAVPRSLMEYADAGIRAIAWSFTSRLTHLHAKGTLEETVKLYLQGTRLVGLAVFLLTAYIAAFGTAFLRLWQGSAFVTGPWRNRSSVVLLILIAAFLPRLVQNMTSQLLYATNKLQFLMWISLLEGGVKVALGLLLVEPWGLAGVAVSNLIPMLLFEGLAIPIYSLRTSSIALGVYLRDAIGRPLFVGLIGYAAGASLVYARNPANWITFLAEASLAAIVGIAAACFAGLTAEDRSTLTRLY